MGLIILSVVIIVLSLFASDRLISRMADEERTNMEIWANATQALGSSDMATAMAYLAKVIEGNPSIPLIMVDPSGKIVHYHNINPPEDDPHEYLSRLLEKYKTGYPPIYMEGLQTPLYIYYSDSSVLRQLQLFPYFLLLIFLLFLGVAIVALVSLKKSDQNRIWEGLARETAHQLGTPTSSLLAWKEYLESSGVDSMVTEEMAKDIQRLSMIADRFQKIGSKPNLQPEDIRGVITRALNYMQPRISKQVTLIPPDPLPEPVMVRLSEPLLAWVFENLIKNAVDAMEGKGTITISCRLRDRFVLIDLKDTGRGIPKGKQREIFRPGVTTRKRGWGLGLSLARRIIEEYHGGRIWVHHSEVGVGTTFRIELATLPE